MLLSVFILCVLPELRVFVCFHTFDGSEELVQGEIFNDNKPIRNINMSVDISNFDMERRESNEIIELKNYTLKCFFWSSNDESRKTEVRIVSRIL